MKSLGLLMVSKILLCILVYISLVRGNKIRSCSSGTGVTPPRCNNTSFYCPVDKTCKSRHQRCTFPSVCINTTTNIEDGCQPNVSGCYNVLLGRSKLFGSSRRKRKLKSYEFNHQFIVYRGFAYEFGKKKVGENNQVKILDIADPQYKYRNWKKLEIVGSSSCTYEDATSFTTKWDEEVEYNLFKTNCQDFAGALIEYLINNVCNEPENEMNEINKIIQKHKQWFKQCYLRLILF